MVNYCIVPGCSVGTWNGKEVNFHHLPRDIERCKQWLRVINHLKYSEHTPMENLKSLRICSLCFKNEDFELNVLGMKKIALLDTAIPSVFTFPDDAKQPGTSAPSSAKRIRLEVRDSFDSISENTHTLPCPSTPGDLNTSASSIEVGVTDKSYQLELTITPTTSSSSEEEGGKDWSEKKLIVNESSLMSLFKFCQMCGKPISSKHIFDTGAQRKVKWTCLGGHSGTWTSSPDVRGMPEVNLLSAAAVLGAIFFHSTKQQTIHTSTLAEGIKALAPGEV
uniref:THAP domain-containing protein 1 n=1 Tax=Dicentrarchus labrax TaxID=13489 RepID=A0A8C4FDB7_DICLA